MISGAHVILYSTDADADRAFLRDVIGLKHIDIGGGWLIFAMPPSELAVHPTEEKAKHELYFMCEDIEAFARDMGGRGVHCSAVQEERWGRLVAVTLPGGSELGVYQPLHERPNA